MFKSGICWFICHCFYLCDDLAILSMDLGNASPLCQEGKDLIELDEKETVKLHF